MSRASAHVLHFKGPLLAASIQTYGILIPRKQAPMQAKIASYSVYLSTHGCLPRTLRYVARLSKLISLLLNFSPSLPHSVTHTQVDISGAFAYVSAPKDPTELGLIKKACQITCTVFSKHVKKEIVTIVDVEKKVKHSKLAEDIEQAIVDGKYSPPGSADEVVRILYSRPGTSDCMPFCWDLSGQWD